MASVINATPRAILHGIQDQSQGNPIASPEQVPSHLPVVMLLMEKGGTDAQILDGASLARIHGTNTMNLQSKFATHQTVLAAEILKQGNAILAKRLLPPNAKKASLRLSLELVPSNIPVYARNSDGSIQYTPLTPTQVAQGVSPVPVVTETIIGTRMVWHRSVVVYDTVNGTSDFGTKTMTSGYRSGSFIPPNGTSSKLGEVTYNTTGDKGTSNSDLYPILDMEINSQGEFGNRTGVRISAPTIQDNTPVDTVTMNAIKSVIYRLTCVEKSTTTNTPLVVQTNGSEMWVNLALKNGVTNPQTGAELSLEAAFTDAYDDTTESGITIPGPFGKVHVYNTYLNTVLDKLTAGYEASITPATGTTAVTVVVKGESDYDSAAVIYGRDTSLSFGTTGVNNHLFNILTGVDQNNVSYFASDVTQSVYFGGVSFGAGITHYAAGGDDGLFMDAAGHPDTLQNLGLYHGLVADQCSNWGDLDTHFLDIAKYPCTAIWDSGFDIATKKTLLTPMARSKQMFTILATHEVARPVVTTVNNVATTKWVWGTQNTPTDENAIAILLSTAALVYPESDLYGTSACRASVIGRSGRLINSTYKGVLPLTIDLAGKVASYMGAGDGKWKAGFGFDSDPRNIVSTFKDVNITYQKQQAYNKAWAAGLTWVQSHDTKSLFYPAFKTVYPDDTSVLNSFITVFAACDLERICHSVWIQLTGDSRLTALQRVEKSNTLISQAVEGKFDSRFVIVPNTFYTQADVENGFSWSCRIDMYANNMATVGSFTIVGRRMSDLTNNG